MPLIERLISDGWIYLGVYFYLFSMMAAECVLPLRPPLRLQLTQVSLLGLTLMLGLRWETGTDFDPYLELFKSLELDTSSLLAVYSFDIGYVLLNALVRLFTDNYTIFLLVNSALAMMLIYRFIRRTSTLPSTSVFIFYNSYFVGHFMGSNRRIMAIGFLLLLFTYVPRPSWRRFASLQGLAVAFHRSSIVGLLSLLIPSEHFTRKKVLLLFAVCGVFGALQLPVGIVAATGRLLSHFSNIELIEKMIFYGETSAEHVSSNFDVFTQSVLALSKRALFLLMFFATIRRGPANPLHARLLNTYIVGIALYVFFIGSPIFQVLSTYFCAAEIALIGIAAASMNRLQRINLCCVLLPYGILQLASALNTYPDLYLPYLSVFSETQRWITN